MRSLLARTSSVAACSMGALLFPAFASAHEKWFHDAQPFPTRVEEITQLPGILAVGIGLAATVIVGLLWRARKGRDLIPGPQSLGATEAGRTQFYAIVPLILAVHVALPLIVLGIRGLLFSPNHVLESPWLY